MEEYLLRVPCDIERIAVQICSGPARFSRRLSRLSHVPHDGGGAPALSRGRSTARERLLEIPLPPPIARRMDRLFVA